MNQLAAHLRIPLRLLRRTLLVLPVAMLTGSLVALFLWLLDWATNTRWRHPWLLWLLPAAGIVIHRLYKFWGKDAARGNNLIMDEIHEPSGGVPARMAPLVIATTIITHLFGGSAGREGTAVQVGGSTAGLLGRWMKLNKAELRILLMSGIAAGFGAVFGTPIAGTIFALEVLAIGRIQYDALWPCFVAAIVADAVCSVWGIHHTHYSIAAGTNTDQWLSSFNAVLLMKVIAAAIAFGLAGRLFATLTHHIKAWSSRFIKPAWLIPVIGGCVILLLALIPGNRDYLGLGVTASSPGGVSIVHAFKPGGAEAFSWLWKLVFTAITLGTGFKGGEVTPLFFIGATLGNTLAVIFGVPAGLLAGLGFIAVFAGATNTPLACTLMGVELFGGEYVLYYAAACFTAYYFSGKNGIYTVQRTAIHKHR